MTKKRQRNQIPTGIPKEEFNALVDNDFQPATKRKGGMPATVYFTEAEYEALAASGADPRLHTKSAAAFHAVMGTILGQPHGPTPDEDTIAFLNNFDKHMRSLAKANGIEVRDDASAPSRRRGRSADE